MALLIGTPLIDTETIKAIMSSPGNKAGTVWMVYQNHELGHVLYGAHRFLAVGPNNTISLADTPDHLPGPDGWRWVRVGVADPSAGLIKGDEAVGADTPPRKMDVLKALLNLYTLVKETAPQELTESGALDEARAILTQSGMEV